MLRVSERWGHTHTYVFSTMKEMPRSVKIKYAELLMIGLVAVKGSLCGEGYAMRFGQTLAANILGLYRKSAKHSFKRRDNLNQKTAKTRKGAPRRFQIAPAHCDREYIFSNTHYT